VDGRAAGGGVDMVGGGGGHGLCLWRFVVWSLELDLLSGNRPGRPFISSRVLVEVRC